ncbi:hypothetical protein A2U01_0066652, partial [Trifolium medium]|nr:hypothetical protein [Trifolium medium]
MRINNNPFSFTRTDSTPSSSTRRRAGGSATALSIFPNLLFTHMLRHLAVIDMSNNRTVAAAVVTSQPNASTTVNGQ